MQHVLSRLQGVKRAGRGYSARCPAHDDRHNSLSIAESGNGTILLKCHAGCPVESVVSSMGLTFRDLFPQGRSDAKASGKKEGNGTAKYAKIACTYPYTDENGTLLFEVVRMVPKSFFQRRPDGSGGYVTGLGDCRRVLYRLPEVRRAVAEGIPVFLCEGEKDVESLRPFESALGFVATTVPMGAGKWNDGYAETLSGARLYVCPDLDDAGRAHAEMVREKLKGRANVTILSLEAALPGHVFPKGADIGDYLEVCQDGAQAIRRLLETGAEYRFPTMAAYMERDYFEELARTRARTRISTGFASLDGTLGGQLYPGLFVIGSVSSLGKSAFVGQMAEHIASQGFDVLFFSLEMARYEMISRSLSRVLYQQDPARYQGLNVGHVLYGAVEDEQVRAAARRISETFGRHMAYIEGNLNITAASVREWVERHVKATGNAPVVVIDYLQILQPEARTASDKQAVDENITALKRISRDFDTPVIAVSSFNRQNYAADATFASFKESGAIEYSADFVMALQARGVAEIGENAASEREASQAGRDIQRVTRQAKMADPRPIEAVVLKNRRGQSFGRFALNFYPRQNLFVEVAEGFGDLNSGIGCGAVKPLRRSARGG